MCRQKTHKVIIKSAFLSILENPLNQVVTSLMLLHCNFRLFRLLWVFLLLLILTYTPFSPPEPVFQPSVTVQSNLRIRSCHTGQRWQCDTSMDMTMTMDFSQFCAESHSSALLVMGIWGLLEHCLLKLSQMWEVPSWIQFIPQPIVGSYEPKNYFHIENLRWRVFCF